MDFKNTLTDDERALVKIETLETENQKLRLQLSVDAMRNKRQTIQHTKRVFLGGTSIIAWTTASSMFAGMIWGWAGLLGGVAIGLIILGIFTLVWMFVNWDDDNGSGSSKKRG